MEGRFRTVMVNRWRVVLPEKLSSQYALLDFGFNIIERKGSMTFLIIFGRYIILIISFTFPYKPSLYFGPHALHDLLRCSSCQRCFQFSAFIVFSDGDFIFGLRWLIIFTLILLLQSVSHAGITHEPSLQVFLSSSTCCIACVSFSYDKLFATMLTYNAARAAMYIASR